MTVLNDSPDLLKAQGMRTIQAALERVVAPAMRYWYALTNVFESN